MGVGWCLLFIDVIVLGFVSRGGVVGILVCGVVVGVGWMEIFGRVSGRSCRV